jgi:RNA polymerase subunit RPABC4/transcription elongation factor Spt4
VDNQVETKLCLYCAEPIRVSAKACPHCGRWQSYLSRFWQDPFRLGFGKGKKTMNDNVETKACGLCAEPIRVAAKICPYCRSMQPRWKRQKQFEQWISLGAAFLMMIGLICSFAWLLSPGRDFALFQSQFTVVNPEMSFNVTTKGNYISTIGQVRNGSPYAWKDVYVEVQYFSKEGKMIDTCTWEDYSEIILAGATQAFKVRGLADKPASQYSTQKVFIRSAKDARKWP